MEDIKRIPTKLEVADFIIEFEYETFKGHKKRKDKRIITYYSRQEVRDYFKKWARTIRTMSNVKILDTVEIEGTRKLIVY